MANQDLGGQLSQLQQMKEILSTLPDMFDKLGTAAGNQTNSINELANEMQSASDESEGFDDITSALEKMAGGADDAAGSMGKMGKAAAVAGSVLHGAQKGMSTFKNVLGGTFNMISSLTSGIFNLAKGAVGALMQSWSGLMGMAQDVAAAGDDIAKAFEKVRGQFGDLASNEGAAVVAMQSELKSSLAATTGGMGVATFGGTNLTYALEAMAEIAGELGPAFNRMADDFTNNAAAAFVMNKGLDMSAGALAGLRDQAAQAGEDMTTALEETTVQVMVLSKQYGVSGKVIGKNLSKLTENMGKFGHMSRAELSATAAYSAKLGVEIESLQGMFDKFENFESAAEGAAKLAETFGMNVDAMALMNAESPAEQMDMMRQAFNETGKSLDDMSRQEKAYLAEQMGVDANDLYAMMDPSNMDISYDDMVAEAENAQEKMSPEEAMMEAAQGIEKSIEHMMEKVEGFFNAFIDGFMHALAYTQPFQDAMQAIRGALREVFEIGQELARELFDTDGVFGDESNGALSMLEGLLGNIVGWFRTLKDQIVLLAKGADDGGISMKTFFNNMWDATIGFFNSPEFQAIGGAILDGLAGALEFVLQGATDLILGLVDGLANGFTQEGPNMFGDASSPINEGLAKVFKSLSENLGPLMSALGDLAIELLKKLAGFLADNPGLLIAGFAVLFGPAVISGLISMALATISSLVTTILIPALAEIFLGAFASVLAGGGTVGAAVSAGFGAILAPVGAAISAIAVPVGIAIAVLMSLWEMFKTLSEAFDFITDDANSMGEKLGFIFGSTVDMLLTPWKVVFELFDFLTFGIFDLSGSFDDALTDMKMMFASLFDSFTPALETVWANMKAVFGWIKNFVITAVIDPFYAAWESLSALFTEVWAVMSPIFDAMGQIFSIVFEQTWIRISSAVTDSITYLGEMFTGLYNDYIAPIITPIAEFLTPFYDKFMEIVTKIGEGIATVASYFNPMTWISMASDAITGFMQEFNLAAKVGEAAAGAVDSVKSFFGISSPSTVMAGFGGNVVDGFMGSVSAMPDEMLAEMQRMLDFIWQQLQAIGQFFLDAITSYINLWLSLPNKIIEFVDIIVAKFIEFLPMISDMLTAGIDFMVEIMTSGMNLIVDAVMFLPTKFIEVVSMITETLFGVDIAAPFKDGIEMVKGFLADGIDFFMNTFSPAALGRIAVDALDGFLNMFSIGDALSAVFGDLPGIVKSVLGISSPSTVFAELGGNVTDGFSGSVEEMPAKMEEMMGALIDKAIGAFNNMTGLIMDFVYGYIDLVMMMPNAFIDGIQYILDAIIEFAPMVSGYLGDMITNMTDILQTGVSFLLDIFMFMPTKMIEAVSSITDALFGIDIATPFKEGFAAVKDTIMDAITFFMETFSPAAMLQAATDIVAGFVQGFNLSDAIAEKAEAAWDSFTGFFGIASPSALMAEAGGNISDGFAAGTEGMDQALVGNTDKATALLAEVDKVSSSLNGMDAIEAESTVSKVAAGLSGDGTVTVQHEGLNIQVNFKVNIDSKDLAAALGDDAEGGPFFVINTSRGGADAGGAEAAGE